MHDDYMPEILSLRKKMDKLERTLKAEIQKRQPTVQYIPLDDDDKMADMVRHLNENNLEISNRLDEVEEDLNEFIQSVGVGAWSVISLDSTSSLFSHHICITFLYLCMYMANTAC